MATTEAATEPVLEAEPDFPPHRMTIDFYERLIDSGVFGENSPVFLWHGRLVEKMAPGLPHVFVVTTLSRIFQRLLPEGWYSLQEQPVVVADDSMPEPDLSIVRGSISDYLKGRPTPGDVAILIEVSDSSLAIDSRVVLRSYAAAGIPIYWIVNLPDRRIEVFSVPGGSEYREHRVYGPDDEVPLTLDGLEVGRIAVRDVLP